MAGWDVAGAACLGAATVLLGWGPASSRRVSAAVTSSRRQLVSAPERRSARAAATRPALVAAATVAVLATTGVTPAVVVVAGCIAWLVAGLRARSRARRDRRATHTGTTAACEALGAELAAGLPAAMAIERVAGDYPVLRAVAAHVRLGGDAGAAFRTAAERPGAEGLADVAAAWTVSARAGGALASVLDRVVDDLRARDDLVREVDATLGPPRATARLLAVLPVLALALGAALGGNPVAFLLGGGAGSWCLVAGVALAALGVLWVERITDGVAR
ncbi:type II secretion system F family protein [Mumia sp. zg.B17]|uniref:type II secretion system F family protein n=1 Tax=Mumia sp. zg.B17 TaxID=2855446 RepID=UPI001C6F0301|nr:type II secretion system F family protein [Mumia sp. zg.B17]MBW9207409.1 type II secretion system F family protein [Mumia sp. zg.B17]